MIGVDGGADALLEFGYKPDLIVGDMDSVSDKALFKCRQIIVHAYPDGSSPGMERIRAGSDSQYLSLSAPVKILHLFWPMRTRRSSLLPWEVIQI